jgi:hypothetical protein
LNIAVALGMSNDNDPASPAPSHDDLSNPGSERNEGIPEFDNESRDRDDDRADAPSSDSNESRAPEEKITGKPISDMAPPGQDETAGNE